MHGCGVRYPRDERLLCRLCDPWSDLYSFVLSIPSSSMTSGCNDKWYCFLCRHFAVHMTLMLNPARCTSFWGTVMANGITDAILRAVELSTIQIHLSRLEAHCWYVKLIQLRGLTFEDAFYFKASSNTLKLASFTSRHLCMSSASHNILLLPCIGLYSPVENTQTNKYQFIQTTQKWVCLLKSMTNKVASLKNV